MSGRPELSTALQDPNVEPSSSASAVIALIGPNATHRRVMASALSGSDARAVREFVDYPANLGDVTQLMEERFDVVMIDVDSDQSYALQIIAAIAAHNTSIVMAYSMRDDADLIRECMRAGARDFLPLPEDGSVEAEPAPVIAAEPEPELVHEPEPAFVPEPEPVPVPVAKTVVNPEPAVNPADFLRSAQAEVKEELEEPPLNPADFLLATPRAVPEPSAPLPTYQPKEYSVPSRPQFFDPRRTSSQPIQLPASMPPSHSTSPVQQQVAHPAHPPVDVRRSEPASTAVPPPAQQIAHPAPPPVRRSEPVSPKILPEELRRPPAAPAKPSKEEVSASKVDEIDAWDSMWIKPALPGAAKNSAPSVTAAPEAPAKKAPAPAIPSGPQLVHRPLAKAEAPSQPTAQAAAPMFSAVDSDSLSSSQRPWMRWVLLVGAPLVIIGLIMLVFMPSHRAAAPAATQAQPVATQTPTSDAPIASTPTESRTPPKPSAAVLVKDEQAQAAPVSSAMMDAQLNAPTRISGSLKRPAPQADEPPSSFAPGAMDGGSALPGQVFGSSRGVKVVAAVSAISAGVADGMLLHKTAPIYPEIAKSAHVSGTVVLGANITKSGALTNLHVLSGPSMLRSPALDAVKTWRYRPYELNHQPVEVETTIRVVFSLEH